MQNEMDYFYYYKRFLLIQDFEKIFWKIVGALLVYDILNNNIYLYWIDYYKFFQKYLFY